MNLFATLEVRCGARRSFFVFSGLLYRRKTRLSTQKYRKFQTGGRKMGSSGGAKENSASEAP